MKNLTIKIRVYIFTYEREEMLCKVVEHLNSFNVDPIIFDDGSKYETNLPNYNRHEHRGKQGFWRTWDDMLRDAELHKADLYIFMPDDFQDIDIERIKEAHNSFQKPYVCNIINDGRTMQWVRFKPIKKLGYLQVGFTDCGFFCDRLTLEKLEFKMNPIADRWFKVYGSSGVGNQLSQRLFQKKVPIYLPNKSFAFHGDHESKMHPEERLKHPLISK